MPPALPHRPLMAAVRAPRLKRHANRSSARVAGSKPVTASTPAPPGRHENKTLEVAKKEANEKKLANIGAKKAAKKGGAVAVRCSALRPPARPPARPPDPNTRAGNAASGQSAHADAHHGTRCCVQPAAACNPLLRATRCCVQPPAQVHTAAA